MDILVLNCGSSSLKYQLINMKTSESIATGVIERISEGNSIVSHKKRLEDGTYQKFKVEQDLPDHKAAIQLMLDTLMDAQKGVISSLNDIVGIGHRVVHGGEKFKSSVIINEIVLNEIKECIPLAPLHNPANVLGIETCQELMPGKSQVAVFDTAFHSTMPEHAYFYPIPRKYYEKYKIRRYGFHGTSHGYVSKKCAQILGKNVTDLKIITCHLGNGASVAAVDCGKSIDTSMGFTPLEGLMMGTRCGDIDPAIVPFLQKQEGLSAQEVDTMMNKESGLKGLSEVSNDMRDLEEKAIDNDEVAQKCRMTLDTYAYKVRKYIGAYAAAMGGVDAIVFTAGVGENGADMRAKIVKPVEFLGFKLDTAKNDYRGENIISTEDSKVKVLVIPTNEELVIAQDTFELIKED